MAKKQKAKDKSELKDNSIDAEADIEEAESLEDEVDSLDEDSDESYIPEEKIKDLEEALLRSRAELDNAFKDLDYDPQIIDFPGSQVVNLPKRYNGRRLGHLWSLSWVADNL